MRTSQSVPELVAAARANAKTSEDRISGILKLMEGQKGTELQVDELCAATVALELAAIDIFSLFEARMQHHFKRGPFSRKLKSLLLESKQAALAHRVHQYYLAINVLKHGKGASYRELLDTPNCMIVLKPIEELSVDDVHAPSGIIDVSVPSFFNDLTTTILDSYHFLKNKEITSLNSPK